MAAAPPLTFASHTAVVNLHSADEVIRRGWRQIMGAFLRETAAPLTAALHLSLTDSLPEWPRTQRIYQDQGPAAVVNVYADDHYWWLHYLDGALVRVPKQTPGSSETAVCRGWVTPAALALGRLEDVTFTSLAPLLRRQNIFMLHAFAAGCGAHTTLIIGPSGSGKTTTGLWLLEQGWQLLANDVVLLQAAGDQIVAYPTPNLVGIRPPTLSFLPNLTRRLNVSPTAAATLTADEVADGRFAPPAPVTHLYLLARQRQKNCALQPLPASVVVARLMEESVDRWDSDMLLPHLTFLTKLAGQCQNFELTLGDHPDKTARCLPVETTTI